MRTTVDIPDPAYRQLKAKAALQGCTVKEIIVRLVTRELQGDSPRRHTTFPLIRGKESRRLDLTNEEINEILFG
jgi:hypothetical protein